MQKKIGTIISVLLILMFLVFLTLKLLGTIQWSWWWVTSPLWIPMALQVLVVIAGFIFGAITLLILKRKFNKVNESIENLMSYDEMQSNNSKRKRTNGNG